MTRTMRRAVYTGAACLLMLQSTSALPQQATSSSSSSRTSSSTRTRSSSVSLNPSSSLAIPGPYPTDVPSNNTNAPTTDLPPQIPDIPEFALTYAPIVVLNGNESYWPSSLDVHLNNTYPWEDYRPLNNVPNPLTLENLDFVNTPWMYLSDQNPAQEPRPDWYMSDYGKPDSTGYSGGNVTIIAVNKTGLLLPDPDVRVVDVFYFLFYSFNDGNTVGGQSYGNHVSDWEHIMVRFYNEQPQFVFLSQHEDGVAYTWDALQKNGNRFYAYSAIGGHANYPVAGTFNLVSGLIGLIYDSTAVGPQWDVIQNYNAYWWSGNDGFINANGTRATTWDRVPNNGYLKTQAKWGNQALQADNPNQMIIFGQEAWSDGATGPGDPSKGLARVWLCLKTDCVANNTLPTSDAEQITQLSTQSTGDATSPNIGARLFVGSTVALLSSFALFF